MPILFDTHAHLYLCKDSIDTLMIRAKAASVTRVMNVALDIASSKQVLDSASIYPNAYPTVGIHPCEAHQNRWEDLVPLLNSHPEIRAIGEIGLDYYHDTSRIPIQQDVFEAQLRLAERFNLPVIIHNRLADTDVIDTIQRYPGPRKVIHCFSADMAFFQAVSAYNCWISFTGLITKNISASILDVVRQVPIDRMMIETDCPYLTPKSHGKIPNEPAFVGEIARAIAAVRGISVDEVCEMTTQTALDFFGIQE